MIFVSAFLLLLLILLEILAVVFFLISLAVLGTTSVCLVFKRFRKLGWILLGASLLGAFSGILMGCLMSLLFHETPDSVSFWVYLAWGLLGYAVAGSLAGMIYGGIQVVLVPFRWLRSKKAWAKPGPFGGRAGGT